MGGSEYAAHLRALVADDEMRILHAARKGLGDELRAAYLAGDKAATVDGMRRLRMVYDIILDREKEIAAEMKA